MKKRFLSVLLGILMACCLGLTACSWFGNSSGESKIVLDSEIVSTVELGSSFTVPTAHLVNEKDEKIEGAVELQVLNPSEIIIATSAMEIVADKVGTYKITYSYQGVESLVCEVRSQDTVGPMITANDVFYNLYKDEPVVLPTQIIEDVSGVDYTTSVLKVYKKDNPSKEYTVSNMGTFVPDEVGEYVYLLEICDTFGNKSSKQWEFTVVDKTWMAEDATGKVIASFDSPEYANVFGGGTATDRQGNPDVEILDEYQGETGVAKVAMNYFNHNFGYYSSFNLRFPRAYAYEEGKRLAIRMRIEDSSINLERLNVMAFEHTHIDAIGVAILGYLPIQEDAWFTAVLPSSVLKELQDSNGLIPGVQIDVKQDDSALGTVSQVLYIASITEIEQLATPTNVAENGNKITWNQVANATSYQVSINGESQVVSTNEMDKPEGGYKIKVKALGDGVIYEDSQYSVELTNMLSAPTGVKINESKVVSWNAVNGAQGYALDINGEQIDVGTATTYTFDKPEDKNYIIKVKAKGDGNPYYDSDYTGILVRYVGLEDGVVADFADQTYVYDVTSANIAYNCVEAGMVASAYSAEYLESYDGEDGVLKIKITTNVSGWGVVALKLPQPLEVENLNTLSIRFRVEGVTKGPFKGLRLYGYGNDTAARALNANCYDAQLNDWFTVTFARKGLYEGIEYAFNNSQTSQYILFGVALMPAERDYYIYLDEITAEYAERLATPENLQMANGVLTWDEVEGAESYVVTVNGEEEVVNTNSYQLPDKNYVITVRAEAQGYIESYESSQVTKRQEINGELLAKLDQNTYAKFDDERYVYYFENVAANGKIATAEIIADEKGVYDKVLHISGNGGYNKVYIHLPKALPANFTIQYRMDATPLADANLWEVMTASEGWAFAWRSAKVENWTSYEITEGYGYEGKDKLAIGVNMVGDFDLYIAIIEKKLTQAELTEELASKLVDNQLATFDESAYLTFVEGQDLEIFEAEIIDDPLGEKGKVLHVTAKPVAVAQLGTPRIVLFLPKAVTAQFTLNYRVAIDGADDSINAWGIMWPGASAFAGGSWDLGLKPCSNVEQWTNNPVGGGYAGLNYIVIGLNQVKTYDFYFSGVVEGWVN